MKQCDIKKLCPLSFGLALGIIWAFLLFFMALIVYFAGGFGVGFVKSVGSVYLGYKATVVGAFIGALWGFIDAFAGGVVFVWLYNIFCNIACNCKPKNGEENG